MLTALNERQKRLKGLKAREKGFCFLSLCPLSFRMLSPSLFLSLLPFSLCYHSTISNENNRANKQTTARTTININIMPAKTIILGLMGAAK